MRFFYFFIFILFIPLFIIISALLLFSYGTPIFFTQERVGFCRIPFKIYKFRTMIYGQVHKLGYVLRRTGLDELPQLLNLIKGDINLIGPRPLTLEDVRRLKWDELKYDERWQMKPGLTGLAQFSPRCHPKISYFYDMYYARNRSLCLNLKIFLWSFMVLFLGKDKVIKFIHRNRQFRK